MTWCIKQVILNFIVNCWLLSCCILLTNQKLAATSVWRNGDLYFKHSFLPPFFFLVSLSTFSFSFLSPLTHVSHVIYFGITVLPSALSFSCRPLVADTSLQAWVDKTKLLICLSQLINPQFCQSLLAIAKENSETELETCHELL